MLPWECGNAMSKKPLTVKDRFGSELILIGGAILSRTEAAAKLTREGVPRAAIDWCVYSVPKLTDEELLRLVRAELIFTMRLRYQGVFRERAKKT
jgi:hypothetical protein